jgi:hypothetical protein
VKLPEDLTKISNLKRYQVVSSSFEKNPENISVASPDSEESEKLRKDLEIDLDYYEFYRSKNV